MIKVNGVLSNDFVINFHFLFLGKFIACVVKYIKKKKKKKNNLWYSNRRKPVQH